LESRFAEIAESQPELLARHYAESGQVEKEATQWGKAGQRSLARSALVESAEQLSRALALIASLPSTPALRHEEIKLQVELIAPLIHVKGYGAAETKEAVQKTQHLIRQAEERGEPPDDPLLSFSVLFGFWVASYVAFNGRVMRELAAQFTSFADCAMQGPSTSWRSLILSLWIAGYFAHGPRPRRFYKADAGPRR
jgi:hypothetical protein